MEQERVVANFVASHLYLTICPTRVDTQSITIVKEGYY